MPLIGRGPVCSCRPEEWSPRAGELRLLAKDRATAETLGSLLALAAG